VVAFGFGTVGVWLMLCVSSFSTILDSLTTFHVEICRIRFESLLVSKTVEICRFLVYLVDL
jgi:hypothetical protein